MRLEVNSNEGSFGFQIAPMIDVVFVTVVGGSAAPPGDVKKMRQRRQDNDMRPNIKFS